MSSNILDEIPSESLQKLLTSVVLETSPPGSTHIQALDAHFLSTMSHPSSVSSLNRGDVIEIQGPSSSGKTHLLYHLLITCITPSSYFSVDLGGWDKACVVFDSDGTFDACRLHELLLSRLSRLLLAESCDLPHIQELANRALEKLHLFRPTSSNQLAVTLLRLPTYHTTHLPETDIGLLAIDSISSFYWPDRLTVEHMRSAQPATSWDPPLQHVLIALQGFRISHAPVTVLTNWGLNPLTHPSDTSTPMFYRQHLHPFPSPFKSVHSDNLPNLNAGSSSTLSLPFLSLTHHITLSLAPILPFRAGISLEEAKDQEEMFRKEVVDKGTVVGLVRTPGCTRVGRFLLQIEAKDVTSGEPMPL